jgi:surfactin synthase thioesterase subunit
VAHVFGAMDAWSRYTSGRFRRHILDGGHFFLREDRARFLELLAQELEVMAAGDPQEP